jgi:hypothetical protein
MKRVERRCKHDASGIPQDTGGCFLISASEHGAEISEVQMRFTISGADRATGEEVNFVLEAKTVQEARSKAIEAGYLVSRVAPAATASRTTSVGCYSSFGSRMVLTTSEAGGATKIRSTADGEDEHGVRRPKPAGCCE